MGDHRAIIFFLCILWLIVIVICIVNIYYYTKIYNEGGTEIFSDGSAYTYAALSFIVLLLSFFCFVGSFYMYYEESKRCNKRNELDKGITIADSEINAINKTYAKTSTKLSKDIQDQMDDQVRGTVRVINSKNRELNEKDKEIYDTKTKLYNSSQRQNILENEIDNLSSQLDSVRYNTQQPVQNEVIEPQNDTQKKVIPKVVKLIDEDEEEPIKLKETKPKERKSLLNDL